MVKCFMYNIVFLIVANNGISQSLKHNLYLQNIKEYRDNIIKQNSENDTLKYKICSEKMHEFLNLKQKYLIKLDIICDEIKHLNDRNDGYYYHLKIQNNLIYDWGNCNRRIIKKDSLTTTYLEIERYDCGGEDIINATLSIEKTAKFKLDLSGMTNGTIYYRED